MTELRPRDPLVVLASRLSRASAVGEVIRVTLETAPEAVEADECSLALPAASGRRLVVHGRDKSFPPDASPLPLTGDTPVAEAIRAGEPVVRSDNTTILALPLGAMVGVTGGIMFRWAVPVDIDRERLGRAAEVAEWVGLALERAITRDRERRLVQAFRGELLGFPDLAPHLEAFGMYRAPWSGVPLGGDWFDAFRAKDGRLGVVVGDVAGHGVEVTPTMYAIRSYLRVLAIEEPDPAACLARLDEALEVFAVEGGVVTVLVGTYRPEERTLEWVNGGLPPPILRRANGATKELTEGRVRLVGTGIGRRRNAAATTQLFPGDLLVAYTDGMLLPVSEPSLDSAVVAAAIERHGSGPLEKTCNELMELSEHADLRTDDATVLAVRVR